MQVVVLAGGLGTRLGERGRGLPKSLVPIAGRPFLDHQLELLSRGGATRALLCVGHLGGMIRDHLSRSHPPIPVELVDDGPNPAGTGGAVRSAVERGLCDERFLVTYGDSYLRADLRALLCAHAQSGAPATMAVLENHDRWDSSNCVVEDGRVVRYRKGLDAAARPAGMRWIDYGLSAYERSWVAAWPDALPLDLSLPLSRLADEGALAAFEVTERFFEIGSPQGLADLEQALAEGVA
ncbi:MAG: NTP transferase domain-containing protein [Myxococcales bacterium]